MITYLKKTALISCSALAMNFHVNASDLDARVDTLVEKMTLEEKLDMIHGEGFNILGIERLGIPEINMSDASQGLRVTPWPASKGLEPTTAFPASLMLAATWNPEQAGKYATAVAEEFRARNMHILLGPGINIYRYTNCGRNYEYMGEDPYLVSKMVVPYIKGAKSVGVLPVVKHLVANNSETQRKNSNSVVSERALREIYFPGFKAAVMEADVPGLMNAYNLLNGEYCGESSWLLKDVLRKEWGFSGLVVSDWTSIWNSERAANSGVDIEMPGGQQTAVMAPAKMKELLRNGQVTVEEIDSKVRNLIRPCMKMGFYDEEYRKPELHKRDEHAKVALDTAREGIVLLKNDNNFLPRVPAVNQKVVVIGPTAKKTPTTGGGSGHVKPENPISIYDGIKTLYPNAELLESFDEKKIAKADMVVACVGLNTDFVPKDHIQERKNKRKKKSTIASEQAGFNEVDKKELIEGEGRDRKTFNLPAEHNALIERCAAVSSKVTVMINAGSGVNMTPWIDKVQSALWLFYPGQNGCMAAAEIVAGKVNPSGKLPMTIEKKIEDNPAYKNAAAKWNTKMHKKCGVREYQDVIYKEGIFVGYRHFDTRNIEPLFPFGHGLSYTSFEYSNCDIVKSGDKTFVTFTIKNTGKKAGAETAQLYVKDVKSSVPRPTKELKAFKKVFLKKGESKEVTLVLDKTAFSFWHPETKQWTLEPGAFEILLGSSSRDIRINSSIVL